MSSHWPVFLNVLGAGSVTIPVLGALGKKRIGERIAEWRKVKGRMGKKECEENVAETAGRRPSNTEH